MVESGLVNNWLKKYSPKEPVCSKKSSKVHRIQIGEIVGAMLVIVAGVVMSSIISLVEHCVRKERVDKNRYVTNATPK